MITRSNCYLCLRLIGTQPDTCEHCGWHRKVVGRMDGKRGLRNSPETLDRARRNLNAMPQVMTLSNQQLACRIRTRGPDVTERHMYVPIGPVRERVIMLCANSPTHPGHSSVIRGGIAGIGQAANTLGFDASSLRRLIKAETITTCSAIRILGELDFEEAYGINIPVCTHALRADVIEITASRRKGTDALPGARCGCDKPIATHGPLDLPSCLKCGLTL